MLLPGIYDLIFNVPGYVPRSVKNVTVSDGFAIRVDVELIPEQASPDFNGDGIVDLQDLLTLIEYWRQDELTVDIAPLPDGDGIVDEQDLALLIEYWQEEIPDLELIAHWIAHWKLDETEGTLAQDSAGNCNGTLIGGPSWQPTGGMLAGALQFDGIDDYVTTPFVLDPADGEFSVFAWIKGGAPGQAVLSQIGGAGWLLADASDGNLMTGLAPPPGGRSVPKPLVSEIVVIDNQWHLIGFVWDGSQRILYVDDVEVAKDTQANLAGSDNGLYIGTGNAMKSGTYWSGLIDDVRIYNRAVTP
jgi:hypothetical protein